MKKFRLIIFVFVCSFLASCKPELKEVRGVIKKWDQECVTIKIGNDTLCLHTKDARMVGGMPLKDDSVKINYINGRNDTARALVIEYLAPIYRHINDSTKDTADVILTR